MSADVLQSIAIVLIGVGGLINALVVRKLWRRERERQQ